MQIAVSCIAVKRPKARCHGWHFSQARMAAVWEMTAKQNISLLHLRQKTQSLLPLQALRTSTDGGL